MIGVVAIAFEDKLRINKAAIAIGMSIILGLWDWRRSPSVTLPEPLFT
ncbi:MAG: hypothetical protein ABFC28_03085 [Rikenellaceae bacterium]